MTFLEPIVRAVSICKMVASSKTKKHTGVRKFFRGDKKKIVKKKSAPNSIENIIDSQNWNKNTLDHEQVYPKSTPFSQYFNCCLILITAMQNEILKHRLFIISKLMMISFWHNISIC